MPILTCKAVLFDLDGVLVDSTPCVTRIWSAWALSHGLDPAYVVHVAHGQRTVETVQKVAPKLDAAHEAAIIEERETEDTEGLRVLPGAPELLAAIPQDLYTIVTSGTRQLATKRLRVVGLPVPPNMVTADDVTRGKPDPEPYVKGAAAVGFPASECVVFEDAPSGIRAANAAGAKVIGLLTTYKPEELSQAFLTVPSLEAVRVAECYWNRPLKLNITDYRPSHK
jgi:sugar-phosphatase